MADTLNTSNISIKKGPVFGIRHLQAVLLFLNLIVALVCRLGVSFSVVVMTNAAKSNPDFPEYDWNEQQKSYILSSFFWGYTLTQMLGGYWTRRYGVKMNLLISASGVGVLNLLVPYSVSWGGWQIYCAIRFLQGVLQCSLMPAVLQHLAKWSPPVERNRLGGFILSAYDFGTAVAMALPGFIVDGPMGWPGLFYIGAILSFIWCAFWLVFGADEVKDSKIITEDERNYIETSLQQSCSNETTKIPIPWRAILTSKPYCALVIVNCAVVWGYGTILIELPSYMNGVLDLNIQENALYSTIIFLSCGLISYGFIFLADLIMKRNWMTLTVLRKSFNSFGMWIPAAGLIWFGFLGKEQKNIAAVLMTLIVTINSGTIIGCNLGAIDLSPNHTGILTGLLSTCTSAMQILAPLFTGIVVHDEHSRSQWQIVFTVAAFIFCAGDVVFLIWGTAKEQKWNEPNFLQLRDAENVSELPLKELGETVSKPNLLQHLEEEQLLAHGKKLEQTIN